MSKFSERLALLRKERGESQPDLGRLIQRSRSTIQGYESEDKEPSFDALCVLARHFGVTTDYLVGFSDSRTRDDPTFASDTGAFTSEYLALPKEVKGAVADALGVLYSLVGAEMRSMSTQRLQLYSSLFSTILDGRSKVRPLVESGAQTDPVVLSNLLSAQNTMKNEVSVLLDQLLQADISGVSSKRSGDHGSVRRKAM